MDFNLVSQYCYSLLHRQGTGPRAVALLLVLIRMILLRLSLLMYFSIVEVAIYAHARPPLQGNWVVVSGSLKASNLSLS